MTIPTLLLTRPRAQALRFQAQAQARFAARVSVLVSPVLEVVGSQGIPPVDTAEFDVAIFTSENGVGPSPTPNKPAVCVGKSVAKFATSEGWDAALAGATVEQFLDGWSFDRNVQYLYFRGREVTTDLATQLAARGYECTDEIVYHMTKCELSAAAHDAFANDSPVIAPIFSTHSFEALVNATQKLDLSRSHFVFISDRVAKSRIIDPIWGSSVAYSPDADGMLLAIEDVLAQGFVS